MLRSFPVLYFALALLAGCSIGPDFQRPATAVPAAYKEADFLATAESDWKLAVPGEVDQSPWWESFEDTVLSDLMARLEGANQNVQAALANLRLARAQAREARAAFFPSLGAVESNVQRQVGTSYPVTTHTAQLQASWELDIWGGTRRSAESAEAAAEAASADLGAVILSARGELAQSYFQLRAYDDLIALYRQTIEAYEKSLAISTNQFKAGIVTKIDVAQAITQLKAAQAQLVEQELQRRQMEHSMAALLGLPPSGFSLAPAPFDAKIPVIDAGIPSYLLERRPDIARGERRVAAANAKIGVAQSAHFPSLTLNAAGGFVSAILGKWFTAPMQVWSFGPSIALSLFQGGADIARADQAVASWEASVASYRHAVLAALVEVEDQLAAAMLLQQEEVIQLEALASAREAEALAINRYQAGLTTYLTVVTAQATALINARTAVTLKGRRYLAAVALIRALGGGWDSTEGLKADGEGPAQ